MMKMRTLCCLLLLTVLATAADAADAADASNATKRKKQDREKQSSNQNSSVLRKVVFYPVNIVADTLDVAKASVGIGLGLAAQARATDLTRVGAMAYDSIRVGLNGRKFPAWHEMNIEAGLSLLYLSVGDAEHSHTEVGASAHALLVGVNASTDPLEIIDLLGTIFFMDPLEDNI